MAGRLEGKGPSIPDFVMPQEIYLRGSDEQLHPINPWLLSQSLETEKMESSTSANLRHLGPIHENSPLLPDKEDEDLGMSDVEVEGNPDDDEEEKGDAAAQEDEGAEGRAGLKKEPVKSDGGAGDAPEPVVRPKERVKWTPAPSDGEEEEPGPSRPQRPRTRPPVPRPLAGGADVIHVLQQLVDLQATLIAHQAEAQQREEQWWKQEQRQKQRELEYQRQAEEKKRKEDLLDVRTYDRQALPVYQPPGDILTFLTNFQYACEDLQAPKSIWTKLLRPQVSGLLADLISEMKVVEDALIFQTNHMFFILLLLF